MLVASLGSFRFFTWGEWDAPDAPKDVDRDSYIMLYNDISMIIN